MSDDRKILEQKAADLLRRMSYSPGSFSDREGPPTPPPPPPAQEKKAGRPLSSFSSAVVAALLEEGRKTASELTAATRTPLPKKDFAVPAKKSNTGKPAYPLEDEQHARSALGFAKMHGDNADYARVRAKVEQKYPNLLKKQAMVSAAVSVMLSKEADGLLHRAGKWLASEAGTHKTELAGLGILAAPGVDQLQAHARARIAGDYNKAGVKKREFLPHVAHPLAETAGLGVLMAPSIAHLVGHGAH